MNFVSLIKRIAPFALTFAVGLFIASFFVTVTAPNFQFKRSGFKRHREYDRQRDMRINQLESENNRLRNRLEEIEKRDWVIEPSFEIAPPPPVMPMKTVPYKPVR